MEIGYKTSTIIEDTGDSKIEYAGTNSPAKQMTKPKKYSVFHVEGGLGKNVASTAVVKAIKQKHPDRELVVVASYPEVFLNNPYVYRVYRVGNTAYFYDDFILDKDVLVFRHEPYFQTDHILKKKQLIQNWCELYSLDYKSDLAPELYTNMVQDMIAGQWVREKPVMVLHTNGGFFQNQPYNYAWTRDMPAWISEQIVQRYSKDYHIIQVCREERQVVPGTEPFFQPVSNAELFSLLRASHKRILIDSCLQHAAAAFRLPSTVLWIGTSPSVFGYKIHKNIIANLSESTTKLIDAYLFDFQFDGVLHECPIKDVTRIFNINAIFDAVNKQ